MLDRSKARRGLPVQPALSERLEIKAQPDFRALPEQRVFKDPPELQERPERPELQVRTESQDLPDP